MHSYLIKGQNIKKKHACISLYTENIKGLNKRKMHAFLKKKQKGILKKRGMHLP